LDSKLGSECRMLSVIVPAYNEAENIPLAATVICDVLQSHEIDHELIFVDDGSEDQSFQAVTEIQKMLPQVSGLKFTRNFGKEAAIIAGLQAAKGDCCVIMDCDLQHPPQCLPQMYALWQQGFLIVEGIKTNRGEESSIYRFFAKSFYKIIRSFTAIDLSQASDYKLLDRRVVDLLVALPEKDSFFRGLSAYFGFAKAQVPYATAPRTKGSTKWTPFGLFRYALNNITAFSVFPLHLVTLAGCILLLVFLILGVQTLYNYCTGQAIEGFTTVILLQLLIGSALMISLGIIGHYIARIYNEIKGRPRFVIEKHLEPAKLIERKEGQSEGTEPVRTIPVESVEGS